MWTIAYLDDAALWAVCRDGRVVSTWTTRSAATQAYLKWAE